ncbi:MAG: rod shape-determining protein RodA [Lachnospiraceae bacterium]|nr:rod shape-determining protein RodA [Lachnospiraceae bacterium]MBQ2099933.1 rod shape-determining protein RodA [Lachnospiraceae bacterium]MBQ3906856.1 rod shape-determining protein RodA [Lachnospiraceae bacterium]MCR4597934.1 rod shape-determining protein RodA [Acetatifactor sp.]
MFDGINLKKYDLKLVIMTVTLAVIGTFAIGSAEESLQSKQMAGVIAGVVAMLLVSFFNYSWVLKMNWLMYIANLGLLLAVYFLGDDSHGAQRWFEIGSLRFQPSETSKILLILFFAQFIMRYREKLNTFKVIAASVVLIVIPWSLILIQPDLSTSVLLIVVFCMIMFAAGLRYPIIFGILGVVVPALLVAIYLVMSGKLPFVKEYQLDRINAWRYPEEYANSEAMQSLNSVMAIGSGQLEGKGYKTSEFTSVKNGDFISETQTDFIFAVIGEEFGFRGSVVVIVLIMLIALECLSVARKAKDLAGTIIASGMGVLIAFQGFINIGVATFLLPNTGLPLPFVSYGLTSLLSLFAGIGFVLNVRMQSRDRRTEEMA